MGISSKGLRGAQVLCGLLLACTVGSASAQQLVSSKSSGAALVQGTSGLHALDISADGRYVLFSNYSPTGPWAFGYVPENCRVYRKDRQTGELLKVFESDPNGFEFCNGAKISADGKRVAAAPGGPAGPCTAIVLPDGESAYDCGDVTALLVRDLGAGTDEQVTRQWLLAGGDGRVPVGGMPSRYPGAVIHSLSADATIAALKNLAVIAGTTTHVFSIADARMNTLEDVVVQPADSAGRLTVYSVALSQDGSRLAVHATVSSPCLPNSTSSTCQVPVCHPANYWCWISPPPQQYEPAINRIYIIDRLAGTQSVPAALDNLPGEVTLAANAWSPGGNFLNWFELPKFPPGIIYQCGILPCVPTQFCEGSDCELKVHRYNFTNARVRTRQTSFDPETVSLCADLGPRCLPQLSRDGNKLLLGRAVKYPFGGNWQPNSYREPVCITKTSLDSPDGIPEFVECPDGGPASGPGIGYSAPVNWYLQDLITGHTTLVSLTDTGHLFQSSGALLADNGRTAVFRSFDPRLQNLVPGATQYDESRLAEGCFWSPTGSSSNLLVASNDNTNIAVRQNQLLSAPIPPFPDPGTEISLVYVYPQTPVFCPVSHPTLSANLFALDIGRSVNLAARTPNNSGIGTVRMQTLIENSGRKRATMLGVDITIKDLGAGGRVRVAKDTPCEIYPATAGTNDNSVALRCELPALAAGASRQLRWSISSDKRAAVTITTAVSSNEQETRPADNTDIAFAVLRPRSVLSNSVAGVR